MREDAGLLRRKRQRPDKICVCTWRGVFAAFLAVGIVVSIVLQIVLLVRASGTGRTRNEYVVEMGGTNDTGASAEALIELKRSKRVVEWDLNYRNVSGVIQRIALSGPVPYGGAADDATPIVDLCGGSATACDLGTTGRVCGDSDTSLIADSIATIIGNICENPHLYHLNVFTSTFPSGAMRGPLS